jgi:hypothetical protein
MFFFSIAGDKENPYLRMEYFLLGSSIPTVMQVEEGRECFGVQSRQCKLGKCCFCICTFTGKGKSNV